MTLRVRVLDDPALADALRRYQGEWSARFGGQMEIDDGGPDPSAADGARTADILVYPPQQMGSLAEAGALIPVRRRLLQDAGYAADDLFPAVRQCTTAWGTEQLAVPLGAPVLVLLYRKDLLAAAGVAPPETWPQYQRVLDALRDRAGGLPSEAQAAGPREGPPVAVAIEPTAGTWAAHLLLARAAAYAKPADQYSTFFDLQDMRPLIDGPAFVRALTELKEAFQAAQWPTADPAAARDLLLSGRAAMAITWLSAAASDARVEEGIELGVAPLPGAKRVFRSDLRQWAPRDPGDDGRVPYVGFTGRVASVRRHCRNAPTAFRLLAWIGGSEMSRQIASSSPATTLFRTSQIDRADAWVGRHLSGRVATRYARVVEDQLTRTNVLAALRIPATDQYLAALADAVHQVLENGPAPRHALASVAQRWRQITERQGGQRQQSAYEKSLGL